MTVSLTWSQTQGGAAIAEPLNIGTFDPLETGTTFTVWIRHNGLSPITNCRLYVGTYSGSYSGTNSPANDYQFYIGASEIGTLQINTDQAGGFPAGSWEDVFTGGDGSQLSTPIELGDIPAGGSVAFQMRYVTEDYTGSFFQEIFGIPGTFQADMKLTYTYSS